MEKFGIFELLDTLSALVTANEPEEAEMPPQETPRKTSPADDPAFAAPTFPMGAESAFPADAPPQPAAERNALDSLLSRHEAISRKIDKKG